MIGSFHALVLAAGAGRRFGGGKLLHHLEGRPLLHHALSAAFAAPVAGVMVVVGADERIAKAARAFASDRPSPPLAITNAPDWADGLSASLRAGLRALPPCDGAFVFLGDMPWIPASLLPALAEAAVAGAPAAAPAFEGLLGHPVLIGKGLFAAIERLEGDRGGRNVLEALGPALARIATDDPGVLRDVDRPEDLDV